MGNTNQGQGGSRRDRTGTNDPAYIRPRGFSADDECPVHVKIAKSSGGLAGASTPSMQFSNEEELPVVIKWHGNVSAKRGVTISGSWDNWKTNLPLVKSHDNFSTIINLPEGRHEFKFKVDDVWTVDQTLPMTDNTVGTQNNLLLVDKADFHVFDALDRDQQQMATDAEHHRGKDTSAHKKTLAPADIQEKNPKELPFTQVIPERSDFERAHNPPVLPPHLLQVILNKDTPVQCDPNVLPEPNHVMLNHLYALSIKDGVMVLSATHRYKKKYVTTLLYKPID